MLLQSFLTGYRQDESTDVQVLTRDRQKREGMYTGLRCRDHHDDDEGDNDDDDDDDDNDHHHHDDRCNCSS